MAQALDLLVFLGSVRASTPPRPARLGERVARACLRHLEADRHRVALVDPLALDAELAAPFKPHFAYAAGRAPEAIAALAARIEAADGYVMVSPEYNHAMSPALAHLLNHFGASLFAYKPSAIVTYSAGQWGGARAAVGMRSFLSEMGCLPVSAMVHVPRAQEVFGPDGAVQDGQDASAWHGYLGRSFDQLAWWGRAARAGRRDDPARPGAFDRDPAQRNAP